MEGISFRHSPDMVFAKRITTGQTTTLEAVIELHNKGGIPNSNLDSLIKPLSLTDTEKQDLLAFPESADWA